MYLMQVVSVQWTLIPCLSPCRSCTDIVMLLSGQAEKPTDNKRLRMERDALENLLFGLFEKQSTWGFVQLQRETDQPAPWLKVRLPPCSMPFTMLLYILEALCASRDQGGHADRLHDCMRPC
jgi:TFIIF, beta subunit HTH domain